MEESKVQNFLIANGKYFAKPDLMQVKQLLDNADDDVYMSISMLEFKDPMMMLLISLFGGSLGIDRFMLGETGLGIAKLLTCGGLGIWAIVDLFVIQGRAKEYNLEMLHDVIL